MEKEVKMDTLNDFFKEMPKNIWQKTKRIVGRGYGSGRGRTAGKGQRGQWGLNTGVGPGFEGGQTPVYRRLPKRGGTIGTKRRTQRIYVINAKYIATKMKGMEVNISNLVKGFDIPFYYKRLKIIGEGKDQYNEFSKPVNINEKIKNSLLKA